VVADGVAVAELEERNDDRVHVLGGVALELPYQIPKSIKLGANHSLYGRAAGRLKRIKPNVSISDHNLKINLVTHTIWNSKRSALIGTKAESTLTPSLALLSWHPIKHALRVCTDELR
jgi:hypothetical protein